MQNESNALTVPPGRRNLVSTVKERSSVIGHDIMNLQLYLYFWTCEI